MVLSLGWSGPTKSDGMCDIHAEHLSSFPIIPEPLSQFGIDFAIGFNCGGECTRWGTLLGD